MRVVLPNVSIGMKLMAISAKVVNNEFHKKNMGNCGEPSQSLHV